MNTFNFEAIETDHLAYQGATKAEVGYGPEAIKGRYYEYVAENGQRQGVYKTVPLDAEGNEIQTDHTIIATMSHDYRLEPLVMTRLDIQATSAQATVIGVETGGTVGLLQETEDNGWRVYPDTKRLKGATLTPVETFQAMTGNFSQSCKSKVDAIEATAGLDINSRITISGESLGAASCYLLKELYSRGYNVEDVILSEDVSPGRGFHLAIPIKMLGALAKESILRIKYFEENKEIGHDLKAFELGSDYQKKLDTKRKSPFQQGVTSLVTGISVARGRIGVLDDALSSIPQEAHPNYTLLRGRESLATEEKNYQALAEFILEKTGQAPHLFNVANTSTDTPMGHFYGTSIARQKEVNDRLFH